MARGMRKGASGQFRMVLSDVIYSERLGGYSRSRTSASTPWPPLWNPFGSNGKNLGKGKGPRAGPSQSLGARPVDPLALGQLSGKTRGFSGRSAISRIPMGSYLADSPRQRVVAGFRFPQCASTLPSDQSAAGLAHVIRHAINVDSADYQRRSRRRSGPASRPHGALGGQTPYERFREKIGSSCKQ